MLARTKNLNANFYQVNLKWNLPHKAHLPKNFVQVVQAFLLFLQKQVTGIGTQVADGKEIREFDGVEYLMEYSLVADVSLVKAYKADKMGNLIFNKTARNFNPDVATAGKITVVEVEELVETGELDPDELHLPGIYVHRIVVNANPEKRIEQRTIKN